MWVIFAFLSAFFAGITCILAKCGIRKTDSNVATFIRTIIVLLFSLLMVMIVGSFPQEPPGSVTSGPFRKETSIKSYLSTSQVRYLPLFLQQSF